MLSSYFEVNIPLDNEGFGLFSPGHFLWLALGLVFCLVLRRLYRRTARKAFLRKLVAGAALFLELFRALLMALGGAYGLATLPLHLCGLAVYLCALHAWRGSPRLGQFLYAFCLPGALFALFFPDWTYFPFWNVLTTAAFELHILLVCYVFMQTEDLQPSLRSAPSNLAIMLLLALPVYVFDRLTGTNYMFLNWPVVPLTLFEGLGRPGYLLGYLPLLAVTWTVLYLPLGLKKRKK